MYQPLASNLEQLPPEENRWTPSLNADTLGGIGRSIGRLCDRSSLQHLFGGATSVLYRAVRHHLDSMSHIQLVSLYYLAHRGCWPILILTQPMARADGYSMARWYCYGICCDTGRHRLRDSINLRAGGPLACVDHRYHCKGTRPGRILASFLRAAQTARACRRPEFCVPRGGLVRHVLLADLNRHPGRV